MTRSVAVEPPDQPPVQLEYSAGTCNIGPSEIERRRRSGHVGLIVAMGLYVLLLVVGAPAWTRILVALPAAVAASGYLQAWLRFCAGFGFRGVFNFGALGSTQTVEDPASAAADRRRAIQIGAGSGAVGLLVGLIAVLVPA